MSCGVYAISACKTFAHQLNNGHKLSAIAFDTVHVGLEQAAILLDIATRAREFEKSSSRSNKRHQEHRPTKRRKANTNNVLRGIVGLTTDDALPSRRIQQDDRERHKLAFAPLPQAIPAECDGEGNEQGFGPPLPNMEREEDAGGNVVGFGLPPQDMMEKDDVEGNGLRFGTTFAEHDGGRGE